jgi:GAF domain-containing protein
MKTESDPGETVTDRLVSQLDDVTGALESLSGVLDEEEELPLVLQRVCQQVIRAVPGADLASVTLLRDDGPETATMTENSADDVDQTQYSTGEGPCLEAASTGKLVRAALPDAHSRWPRFTAGITGFGVQSFLSAPLFIDSEYHGSLNCYSWEPHGYDKLDAALLELYTTAAEAALRSARRYHRACEHTTHLRQALTSRAVLDQAKGMLMAARGIPADEAFQVLVEKSQRDNVKVREVAERFVAGIIGSPPVTKG